MSIEDITSQLENMNIDDSSAIPIFTDQNMEILPSRSEKNNKMIDTYLIRYKIGISEIDLDEMTPQEKIDFCHYISNWCWGTSGLLMIGGNISSPTLFSYEKDICYLSKLFPYHFIVYYSGESCGDFCAKTYRAGFCDKSEVLPSSNINAMLFSLGLTLRPLEIFFKDPEFVDLDAINIVEF